MQLRHEVRAVIVRADGRLLCHRLEDNRRRHQCRLLQVFCFINPNPFFCAAIPVSISWYVMKSELGLRPGIHLHQLVTDLDRSKFMFLRAHW